jgi:hypothetical protein
MTRHLLTYLLLAEVRGHNQELRDIGLDRFTEKTPTKQP